MCLIWWKGAVVEGGSSGEMKGGEGNEKLTQFVGRRRLAGLPVAEAC